jgi:hypothetical protein
MTIEQIAEAIAIPLNKEDNYEFLQMLYFHIVNARTELLKDKLNKYDSSTLREYTQSFTIDLVKEDECHIEGCITLRSKYKIPKHVRFNKKFPYLYVGTVNKTSDFNYIKSEDLKFTKYNPLTSKHLRYTVMDGYLYVYNTVLLKRIRVEGIFENPEQILKVADCNDCVEHLKDIVIPQDLIGPLMDKVTNRLRTLRQNIENDEFTQK